MDVQIEIHEKLTPQFCAIFSGMILTCKDEEIKKSIQKAFLKLYKTLTIEQKKEIRKTTEIISKDLGGTMEKIKDFFSDLYEDLT